MAWSAREHSRIIGRTRVGCAALDEAGGIHAGSNIEHQFRSHDIHAEVAAISSLVTEGGERLTAILIAAERERFTPCGACLDWIFELGGGDCIVLIQDSPDQLPQRFSAAQLMPHYPR